MNTKKRRIIRNTLLSIFCVILLIMVILTLLLYSRVSSMMSIKKKADGLYTMNYKKNYHLDKVLKAGITNEDELFDYICDELYFGYKIESNVQKYGCSAFSTQTPSGNNLVGRNFDLSASDTLSLYTHPKNGYKSVSSVSTDMVSVGGTDGIKATSLKGRIALLSAPYIVLDGMNEKGLSASLLDTDRPVETHMNTNKPDIIISIAIRLILDRAKTVDEAINLLKQYDINTAHGWTQHIFVSDKNGKSAIIEWWKDEMKVVDYNVCTNFRMSNPSIEGNYSGICNRFDILDNALKEKSKNTVEESMMLLQFVRQNGYGSKTNWSVVFDLDDFKAYYVVNMKYDNMYKLDPKKF